MKVYENNAPADLDEIAQVEEQIGANLPKEYRAFLEHYNGGYPEPDRFRFHAKYMGNSFENHPFGERAILDRFLGVYIGEFDNLKTYLKVYKGRIPSNMIPVAHDPGGNLVCLAIKGDDYGKVFYWRHDEEVEDGEIPDYKNIYYIADNFEQFTSSFEDP